MKPHSTIMQVPILQFHLTIFSNVSLMFLPNRGCLARFGAGEVHVRSVRVDNFQCDAIVKWAWFNNLDIDGSHGYCYYSWICYRGSCCSCTHDHFIVLLAQKIGRPTVMFAHVVLVM
jgi:hypothetical protein